MLRLIKELEGVGSIYFLANNIIYTKDNITYVNNKPYDKYLSILDFSTYDDKLYFWENSKLYQFINDEFTEVIFINDINRGGSITNDFFIGWKKLSRKESEFIVYDIQGHLLWRESGEISINPTNGILLKSKRFDSTKFEVLDLETGSPQWTYTCPEGQKITGEMYEYGGVLAFTEIDTQLKTTAVGIDIKTGNKIWETKKTHLLGSKHKDKAYNYISSHKDERDYLQILDLKTGELEEKTLSNNQKNDYIVWLSTYKEGSLYCSNLAHGCKIGIIDLKKREMIQEYPLNLPEGVQIDTPVVTDDKIYVLDSEQVLHIYERPNL